MINHLIKNSSVKNEIKHSFNEYKTITKEHLYRYLTHDILKGARLEKNYIKSLIYNKDIFNDLVETIILADWTHDSTKSSQRYWRTKCIIYAISALKREKHIPCERLTEDIIYNQTPDIENLRKERAQYIHQGILSLDKRERQIVKYKFYRQFPESLIAEKFKISQVRVSQIISKIKYKLAPQLADLI